MSEKEVREETVTSTKPSKAILRAVAVGVVLASSIGLTTACCQGTPPPGEGEGE